MKVCNAYRENMYHLLGAVFNALEKRPVVAELGVLRGECDQVARGTGAGAHGADRQLEQTVQ